MKIKDDWIEYLHRLRKIEIEKIFNKCPDKLFNKGLELGAGDGFQSGLISKYVHYFISTDYNFERLKCASAPGVSYMACDAEEIDSYFNEQEFDIIFSSNLLEHLPHPEKALRGIHKILKDDGITIHCMPNPLWKFFQLILFYPNLFIISLEKITTSGWLMNFIKNKLMKGEKNFSVNIDFNDNPKTSSGKLSLLFPQPHGAYKNIFKELLAFRKKRWIKEFENADFKIIKIIKGPVFSGYGFGLESVRKILEQIGCSSEYIYVAVKKGMKTPYMKYFGI